MELLILLMILIMLNLINNYLNYNLALDLESAISLLNSEKKTYPIEVEFFKTLIAFPVFIVLVSLIIYNYNQIVYVPKIKVSRHLGYKERTIYGYKGKVWICNGSGIHGEYPAEVIKRIKKYYAGSPLKNDYINAVKYVTS